MDVTGQYHAPVSLRLTMDPGLRSEQGAIFTLKYETQISRFPGHSTFVWLSAKRQISDFWHDQLLFSSSLRLQWV
jgi:hypothetical protein